ncbi:RNA polymerase sigma factor [bacterium]|nr:RNA polymerase sigma factor [bacterium]
MTEAELLNRIKNDPNEFAELFKSYYKPIFGYIFRRTGKFDDSADIAADTFLNALEHINSFSYKGISIKVWLYRIATNELYRYFKQKKRRNRLIERIDFENRAMFNNYLYDDKIELEKELQHHDRFITVLGALKTLPIKYMEVISLRYFEGKDNKEIAQILNMNEGTLKSLLSRGLEKLRKKCNQI